MSRKDGKQATKVSASCVTKTFIYNINWACNGRKYNPVIKKKTEKIRVVAERNDIMANLPTFRRK